MKEIEHWAGMEHITGAEKPTVTAAVIFRVGRALCALPADHVREIVPMAELSRSPGQPSVLKGFLNLRGTAVPVVNVRRLFDLSGDDAGLYSHIIVLKGEPHPTGLYADRVLALVRPAEGDWLPLAEGSAFNQCAEAELVTREGAAQYLSPERLLLEKERHAVAELQARAQRYLGELEASRP